MAGAINLVGNAFPTTSVALGWGGKLELRSSVRLFICLFVVVSVYVFNNFFSYCVFSCTVADSKGIFCYLAVCMSII